MGAGIAKDRAYARMFGTVAPRGLPTMSYFFFFSRDVVTMGASFNIPDPLAEEMTSYGVPKSTADVAAQLFCPVAMQFVTTPMHLLGLDCYNRPSQSFGERVALVAANYRKTVAARIARILPAFGFGGIGNKRCVRAFLRFRVSVRVGVGWGGDRSWVDWPFLCLGAASHPFPRYYHPNHHQQVPQRGARLHPAQPRAAANQGARRGARPRQARGAAITPPRRLPRAARTLAAAVGARGHPPAGGARAGARRGPDAVGRRLVKIALGGGI